MERIIKIIQDNPLFLVGAGASVNAPSNLKSAYEIKYEIIRSLYEKDKNIFESIGFSIEDITSELADLRFELLIQIILNIIDPKLEVFNFMANCDKPNLNHYFFANFIARGCFVVTTNFDSLIEIACKKLGIKPKLRAHDINFISALGFNVIELHTEPSPITGEITVEKLCLGITADNRQANAMNYERNDDYSLIKIHGTLRDLDGNDDKIFTIKASLEQIFQDEGISLRAASMAIFTELLRKHDLLVLGYSGSDDFDIVQLILETKSDKKIIWFEYDKGTKEEQVLTFEEIQREQAINVNRILSELVLKQCRLKDHILKIKFSNQEVIKRLWHECKLGDYPTLSEQYNLNYKQYFERWRNRIIECQGVFTIADILYHLNKLDVAEKLYRICYKYFEKISDLERYDLSIERLGGVYYQRGQLDDALCLFKQSIQVNKKINNYRGHMAALMNLGSVYAKQGELDRAMKLFNESIEILKLNKINDLAGYSKAIGNIGLLHSEKGNLNDAIRLFEESMKIKKRLGDIQGYFASIKNLYSMYLDARKYNELIKLYEENKYLFKTLCNLEQYSKIILLPIGLTYFKLCRWNEAIQCYKEVMKIDKKIGNNHLRFLGIAYTKTGQLSDAIECFQECAVNFRKLGDDKSYSQILIEIGLIYYEQERWDDAIKSFKESIEIYKKINDIYGYSIGLLNLGATYTHQKKFDEAIECYEKSRIIGEKIGDVQGLSLISMNLGTIYYEQGNLKCALDRYEQARNGFEKINDKDNLEKVLSNIQEIRKAFTGRSSD